MEMEPEGFMHQIQHHFAHISTIVQCTKSHALTTKPQLCRDMTTTKVKDRNKLDLLMKNI